MFDNQYNKGFVCIVFLLLISLNLYPITLATNQKKYETDNPITPLIKNNGPMESFWPIQGHDQRHAGQSSIGTIENPPGVDKWSIGLSGSPYGSVLDSNDTIYTVGGWKLHAINPNGTIKWIYEAHDIAETTPAVNEDGTIYFGAVGLHAVNPNGTMKWKYSTGNRIRSSPNIGDDGIIYFGDYDGYLHAVYSNGTLKWKYQMSTEYWNSVESSPAIDQNGFIYCGAQNGKLYSFYPNGTVRWDYQAGSEITYSPCIDDNNIIYISSDGNLHALYQNGTLKWRSNGAGYCSPSITQNGMIICAFKVENLQKGIVAIYPNNGTRKWEFPLGTQISVWHAPPIHCSDGIIYLGASKYNHGYGEIVALYPNGTLYWRRTIGGDECDSSLCIGSDGIVYIGTQSEMNSYLFAFGIGEFDAFIQGPHYGVIHQPLQYQGSAKNGTEPYSYLWDFGDGNTSVEQDPIHNYSQAGNYIIKLSVTDYYENETNTTSWVKIKTSNDPPYKPNINGPTIGKTNTNYPFQTTTSDSDEEDLIYYMIDWDDGNQSEWLGPYHVNEKCNITYSWSRKGHYQIKALAKDNYGDEGNWSDYFHVNITEISINLKNRGFFFTVEIRNSGDYRLEEVNYSLDIDGGIIIFPLFTRYGTISPFWAGRVKRIILPVFGFGPIRIIITAEDEKLEINGLLIGFFIKS